VHIIYQLPPLTLLCRRKQPALPTEWELSGPLAGLNTFGGNSIPQSGIRTCIMQPVCSLVTYDYSNSDGRTPKCVFTKHCLQLWTTLNNLNTGCGCSLWVLYKHSSQIKISKSHFFVGTNKLNTQPTQSSSIDATTPP